VQYKGSDDDDIMDVYAGHPGRVIDIAPRTGETSVSFVNGPSVSLPESLVGEISETDYIARGKRLAASLRPLSDQPAWPFNEQGSEWPEGHPPTGP